MTTSGAADSAESATSSPLSPETASASTKRCSPSPSSKGLAHDGNWLMCGCGWSTTGRPSMRKAKRQFTWHKQGLDP